MSSYTERPVEGGGADGSNDDLAIVRQLGSRSGVPVGQRRGPWGRRMLLDEALPGCPKKDREDVDCSDQVRRGGGRGTTPGV